jgi:transcriptional regulator with XRE-family HTH domain
MELNCLAPRPIITGGGIRVMNGTGCDVNDSQGMPDAQPPARRRLHRLAAARRARKLSLREAARQLDLNVEDVKRQEEATQDLSLSEFYRWQQLLNLPVEELLVETESPLPRPTVRREILTKMIQTVLTILRQTKQPAIRRMAHTLVDQMVDLHPELRAMADAQSAGRQHLLDDQGRAVKGPLPVDFFMEPID